MKRLFDRFLRWTYRRQVERKYGAKGEEIAQEIYAWLRSERNPNAGVLQEPARRTTPLTQGKEILQ